eukprot:1250989-Pleurochrysis_carterae.AAC.2
MKIHIWIESARQMHSAWAPRRQAHSARLVLSRDNALVFDAFYSGRVAYDCQSASSASSLVNFIKDIQSELYIWTSSDSISPVVSFVRQTLMRAYPVRAHLRVVAGA